MRCNVQQPQEQMFCERNISIQSRAVPTVLSFCYWKQYALTVLCALLVLASRIGRVQRSLGQHTINTTIDDTRKQEEGKPKAPNAKSINRLIRVRIGRRDDATKKNITRRYRPLQMKPKRKERKKKKSFAMICYF